MQSQEIARQIEVSTAETAKILQLVVSGGFVTSRRGSKGGFQLASSPEGITMGQVIDFFLSRHPVEPEGSSRVMQVLRDSMASCQKAFGKLSLAQIASPPETQSRKKFASSDSRAGRARRRKIIL